MVMYSNIKIFTTSKLSQLKGNNNLLFKQLINYYNTNFFIIGASSVMFARGALWNASIFSPQGTPFEEVKKEYVRLQLL